jgi:hypothetical protein
VVAVDLGVDHPNECDDWDNDVFQKEVESFHAVVLIAKLS